MTIRARFAPSPTGYLHIGGARTALFNYLFAKHHGGQFLLRIEDTDAARSTQEAKDAILRSMAWLGLEHDEEVVYQSKRYERHQEIAHELVKRGKAYYCFSSQEEIADLREQHLSKGEHFIFHSPWRDKGANHHPRDVRGAVRIKAPREGETVIKDIVQGDVTVQNSHLDDMILLRSDGTPTYMLAVVVDDHDMGITHIIRGDDHLNNAFRQKLIYDAMDWQVPIMAHIPLIHGTDGAKLSKRHGALGVGEYQSMGYLPEALNNYLLRLGWSHGNDEIIAQEQAIKWFNLESLGRSPARLDFDKMQHMNAHYLRMSDNNRLADMIFAHYENQLNEESKSWIKNAIDCMKPRAQLMNDLYDLATIFTSDKMLYSNEAIEIIHQSDAALIKAVSAALSELDDWTKDKIQEQLKILATAHDMKIGDLMKYIRAFITGRVNSPSVFEVIEIIGSRESLLRLAKQF